MEGDQLGRNYPACPGNAWLSRGNLVVTTHTHTHTPDFQILFKLPDVTCCVPQFLFSSSWPLLATNSHSLITVSCQPCPIKSTRALVFMFLTPISLLTRVASSCLSGKHPSRFICVPGTPFPNATYIRSPYKSHEQDVDKLSQALACFRDND